MYIQSHCGDSDNVYGEHLAILHTIDDNSYHSAIIGEIKAGTSIIICYCLVTL